MDIIVLVNNILTFILLLYADPALSRKLVDIIVNSVESFMINYFLPSLEADILSTLSKENITPQGIFEIRNYFKKHTSFFD